MFRGKRELSNSCDSLTWKKIQKHLDIWWSWLTVCRHHVRHTVLLGQTNKWQRCHCKHSMKSWLIAFWECKALLTNRNATEGKLSWGVSYLKRKHTSFLTEFERRDVKLTAFSVSPQDVTTFRLQGLKKQGEHFSLLAFKTLLLIKIRNCIFLWKRKLGNYPELVHKESTCDIQQKNGSFSYGCCTLGENI